MSAHAVAVPPQATGAAPTRRLRGRAHWHRRFVAPALGVLGVTAVAPFAYAVYLSLTASNSGSRQAYFGQAFSQLFSSGDFWNALRVEAVYVVAAIAVEVVLGLGVALLLVRVDRVSRMVRAVLLAPTVMPTIVVALIFDYMLQSGSGTISYYLGKIGIQQAWLDHGSSALAVIVGLDVWQYTPFVVLLLLAALQGVPIETLEAARIDGASERAVIRRVVLPQIAPVIAAVALLRFIDAIQVFPTIAVLTSGGPGTSTDALNYYGFTAFFQNNEEGTGAAIAVLLTVLAVGCAVGLALLLRRRARPVSP